jgi:hypothetical protein
MQIIFTAQFESLLTKGTLVSKLESAISYFVLKITFNEFVYFINIKMIIY